MGMKNRRSKKFYFQSGDRAFLISNYKYYLFTICQTFAITKPNKYSGWRWGEWRRCLRPRMNSVRYRSRFRWCRSLTGMVDWHRSDLGLRQKIILSRRFISKKPSAGMRATKSVFARNDLFAPRFSGRQGDCWKSGTGSRVSSGGSSSSCPDD